MQTGRHGFGGRVFPRDGADGQTAKAHYGGENQKGGVYHCVQRGNRRNGDVDCVRKISSNDCSSHLNDRI